MTAKGQDDTLRVEIFTWFGFLSARSDNGRQWLFLLFILFLSRFLDGVRGNEERYFVS